jgi:peptidoglycan hydrolase-like protein with peptidoglycan-binding domain
MTNWIVLFPVTIGLSLAASVRADDNVREVQTKLSNEGLYFGEMDGAYSSDLSAALSRYQIRNGLPITGQLDAETSKALGANSAIGPSTAGSDQSSSDTWRRLRRADHKTSAKARKTSLPAAVQTESTIEAPPRSAPAATAPTSSEIRERASGPAVAARTSETTESAPAAPVAGSETTTEIQPRSAPAATEATEAASTPLARSSADEFSKERLRDYVAAFVLAGLDKNVGAETEFFADRVEYYDSGTMDREKIREDLKRYDEQWPERHFWLAGKITVEPQSDNRVRVTFPLGFKLSNGNKQSSGKVDKTLVLELAGDDLQIVAVNEWKAD